MADPGAQIRCGTCRHWLRFHESEYEIGVCKRYPPVPFRGGGQSLPQLATTDWCGEWDEKAGG